MQAYSDPNREHDPHALPDVEIFQQTAEEVAAQDEDLLYEYMTRPEFRLATMSSKVRSAMIDAIIEEEGIKGGYFYWFCFPGCMPDSDAVGPFATWQEAKDAAQAENQ